MSSAEPVAIPKKRGRPRKIVPEVEAIEILEVPKKATTTRAKSTKATKSATTTSTTTKKVPAAAKAVKKAPAKPTATKAPATKPIQNVEPTPAVATPPKTPEPEKGTQALSKPVSMPVDAQTPSDSPLTTPGNSKVAENVAQPEAIPAKVPIARGNASASSAVKSSKATKSMDEEIAKEGAKPIAVTAENSKIISKVRDLPNNPFESPVSSVKSPTNSTSTPKVTEAKSSTEKSPTKVSSNSAAKSKTPATPLPGNPSKATPPGAPKPKIPVAAMNSAIVSGISSRAGARPNTSGKNPLPPNYKATARKVTAAIIAMPILLVTSYVLYHRLILGEERKHLTPPSTVLVQIELSDNTKTGPTGE